jgi:hypothetical protein
MTPSLACGVDYAEQAVRTKWLAGLHPGIRRASVALGTISESLVLPLIRTEASTEQLAAETVR